MRATGVVYQLSKQSGGRIGVRAGLLGFTLGVVGASILAIKVVDHERQEMEWSESILNLTRSVRKLETHVKSLEQQYERKDGH
ncbi:LAFE_0F13828g1_1 [Lachancea fermentati]|uniref:LAFE_0F13828g1_1 n=1 Tax=Lachancea fermentati TaxID=4955 RepID=A0A1G4MGB5_LACFM|nr:LAFE_0F13828g1_1 [Lachancea fermentati]